MHYVSISNLYTNLAGWDHELLTKIRSIGLYIGVFSAIAGGYLSDKFKITILNLAWDLLQKSMT